MNLLRPQTKHIGKTQFKGVHKYELLFNGRTQGIKFRASFMYRRQQYYSSYFDTEREAAIWIDKKRIDLGLQPIHILVKKLV